MMLYKFLSRIDRQRFEPTVVSLMPDGMFIERVGGLNIQVHHLGMRQGIPSLGAVKKFRKLLKEIKPDVVQGWMYHGNLLAWLGCKLSGVRPALCWSIHQSLADINAEKKVLATLIRFTAKLSSRIDAVVFSANAGMQQHIENGYSTSNAMAILDNFDLTAFERSEESADLRQIYSLPVDSMLVASVARYAPMKDHKNLITAARLVVDRFPDVHFILVGPGVDNSNDVLAEQIAELKIGSNIHLLGERTDIKAIFSDVNMFVLSSAFSESFPNVLGEAMACHVPCITTDVGDSRVIVGEFGAVVPPGDSEQLAAAIVSYAALPATELEELGQKARRHIENNFNLDGADSFVSKYEALYTRLTN